MAEPASAKPSFWRTVKTMAWAFFGVRKRSGWDEDMARITPMHLVVVGLVAIFVLVLALIGLVNWVAA